MDYKIPIPPKSQAAYWSHKDRENQNAGLIFERFAPDLAEEAKDQGLKAVLEAFQKSDKRLFSEWNTRWERLVRAGGAEPFTMKTDWRLISGLGKKGSYEIGFTFHTYGFPYLPGSSLKGLARSYGLLEIASLLGEEKLKSLRDHVASKTNQKADELGLLNSLDYILSLEEEKEFEANLEVCLPTDDARKMAVAFRKLFGTTAFAGRVVFYDSIPGHIPSLEMDIMNPHYPKYYDGSEFPTNWQSPIPVKFIAVSSRGRPIC